MLMVCGLITCSARDDSSSATNLSRRTVGAVRLIILRSSRGAERSFQLTPTICRFNKTRDCCRTALGARVYLRDDHHFSPAKAA